MVTYNNNVSLIGRLTENLELRYTANNVPAIMFTLAVKRVYGDKNKDDNADFVVCKAYGNRAENMSKFLNKGSLISISGRIETSSSQDERGNIRYYTNVVIDEVGFLETKQQQSQRENSSFNNNNNYNNNNNNNNSRNGYNNNRQNYNNYQNNNRNNNYNPYERR